MCLHCEPYRPGFEDTTSTTVEAAARAERERAEWLADDPPDLSEID